jgi:hypothetical protein
MNKLIRTYIPSISITFTCSIIASAIINISNGNDMNGYFRFIFQFMIFLIASVIIDFLICKTPIANFYSTYLLVELIVLYSLFMTTSYFLSWFNFRLENIVTFTIIYLIIYIIIQFYFYKYYQQEANYINQLIKKQEQP